LVLVSVSVLASGIAIRIVILPHYNSPNFTSLKTLRNINNIIFLKFLILKIKFFKI
jgi:hypothetical protein